MASVRQVTQFALRFFRESTRRQERLIHPRRCFSAASLPEHQVLGMPALSPTMSMGNIVKWKKEEGEAVASGDVLCEVETDKATIDWESVDDGYVAKIFKQGGATDIKVGEPVLVLVEEEEDIEAFKDYTPTTPLGSSTQETETGEGKSGGGSQAMAEAPPTPPPLSTPSAPETKSGGGGAVTTTSGAAYYTKADAMESIHPQQWIPGRKM